SERRSTLGSSLQKNVGNRDVRFSSLPHEVQLQSLLFQSDKRDTTLNLAALEGETVEQRQILHSRKASKPEMMSS
ncbi:hypothetical protein Tco_1305200, partial [Tanacetum coccineum]